MNIFWIDLSEFVEKVKITHPEFKEIEIIEICENYIASFPKKTKIESVKKSLNKYLSKEFSLDNPTEIQVVENKTYCLNNLPKYLLKSSKIWNDLCLLNVSWLYKSLWQSVLFEDANLKINSNDKISLIWRNGSGKSTLLKMIIWLESIDEWNISFAKGLKIGYLSQDLFWNNRNHTLREEMMSVFEDITTNFELLQKINENIQNDIGDVHDLLEQKQSLEKFLTDNDGYVKYALQIDILKYFGFDESQLDLKIAQLSGGEQTKVQIAKFFLQDVDLLIMDEPTNHLDIEGIMFLEKFCKLWQKWLICISHDKAFIDNVFDQIVEISHKTLNVYNGNYKYYIEQKQKNYELDLKNYNNQQKELWKQEDFINRFRAQASKAAQVQGRIKMLDKLERLEMPDDELTLKQIRLNIDIRLPNMILTLTNLNIWYTDSLIKLPKIIEVTSDKKIWIIGKNWVGKTTLLKSILWDIKPLEWISNINERIIVGSYSQVFEKLDMENTIIEELVEWWVSQKEVRTILWWLLITWDKVKQKIGTLSGGEKAKVALTKMLLTKPHLIIMDEPTNHLDLFSKEVIKNMLSDFPWVTLIVSHDRDLLSAVSNQLWVIKEKQLKSYDNLDKWFEEIF